jgi:hypothetical protein
MASEKITANGRRRYTRNCLRKCLLPATCVATNFRLMMIYRNGWSKMSNKNSLIALESQDGSEDDGGNGTSLSHSEELRAFRAALAYSEQGEELLLTSCS